MKNLDLEKRLPVSKLVDISLSVGMVPDAKFHYKWHEYAKWQINAVKEIGLTPEHRLLDIGCGPLRFGMEAINYLEDGNYHGMDPYTPYINLGKLLCDEAGLEKNYTVEQSENFEFSLFKTKFDFAIAQSVFTHLSRSQVKTALSNLKEVMAKGGKFLFTNIDIKNAQGFLYGSYHPMLRGSGMNEEFYQKAADTMGVEVEFNCLSHPTQEVHLFKF
ncbi:class I SAM-dependent methyltransferase [Roseivirga misakiensis]|uniref:Methyltransferase type 12 domain-containing protein n=1 Tax=Roseivirga misakiensis TaxID=1563681 RepID=A0A1E5T1I7_9BACT|nr:class I SAM-dependent methyltransferase [Roseivirga misakiensis]OEK05229.1 hypothetical protein BFP71_17660 [Roseivirga misakiensis]